MRLTVILAVLVIILIFLQVFIFRIPQAPFLSLIEGNTQSGPIVCLLEIFAVLFQLQTAVSISRLIRSMREGRQIHHNAPWKKYWHFGAAIWIVSLSLLAIILVAFTMQMSLGMRRPQELPLQNENPLFLRLSDIEQNPELERLPSRVLDQNGVDFSNNAKPSWSLLSPIQWEVKERGIIASQQWEDGSSIYTPSMTFRYFKLTIPTLGDGLIRDLSKEILSWNEIHNESYPMNQQVVPGIDQFFTRESTDYMEVFAQNGNVVIYLRVHGELAIDEVAQGAIAYLKKG
jgi:hypothetical protein